MCSLNYELNITAEVVVRGLISVHAICKWKM